MRMSERIEIKGSIKDDGGGWGEDGVGRQLIKTKDI